MLLSHSQRHKRPKHSTKNIPKLSDLAFLLFNKSYQNVTSHHLHLNEFTSTCLVLLFILGSPGCWSPIHMGRAAVENEVDFLTQMLRLSWGLVHVQLRCAIVEQLPMWAYPRNRSLPALSHPFIWDSWQERGLIPPGLWLGAFVDRRLLAASLFMHSAETSNNCTDFPLCPSCLKLL